MTQLEEPFEVNGYKLYLDDKDSLDLRKDLVYDRDETNFMYNIIKPDWQCIDIGANIGYFTILMARLCKFVFAFEPDNDNFVLLRNNINLNKINNVVAFCNAVTNDNEGAVQLHECTFNRGMHRIYPSKWCEGKVTKVKGVRLDDFNQIRQFEKINFVKLDIEGAELGALKGMEKLIYENKPVLLIEFHPPTIWEYGHDPKDTYDFLKENGYVVTLLESSFSPDYVRIDNISYDQLLGETYNAPGRNILATPLIIK